MQVTFPDIYSIATLSPITSSEPLPPLLDIPRGSLVIVDDRAPAQRHCTTCQPASGYLR